ncbi:hypothetical protein BJY00DRAFT_293939 [Aspergillus carlsbadensis]|nr:hypothetical protein BJY00DRAFT_293939 [Aspergillus carlsbadensis]
MQMLPVTQMRVIIYLIAMASPMRVLAGDCLGPMCGGVENRSPWPMHWAQFIGSTPGICRIWNGGSGPSESPDTQNCFTGVLHYGEDKGGWNTGIDIDGFTFLDKAYRVKFKNENVEKPVQAGSWTKIATTQWASCLEELGQPKCYIFQHLLLQPWSKSTEDLGDRAHIPSEHDMYEELRLQEEF